MRRLFAARADLNPIFGVRSFFNPLINSAVAIPALQLLEFLMQLLSVGDPSPPPANQRRRQS